MASINLNAHLPELGLYFWAWACGKEEKCGLWEGFWRVCGFFFSSCLLGLRCGHFVFPHGRSNGQFVFRYPLEHHPIPFACKPSKSESELGHHLYLIALGFDLCPFNDSFPHKMFAWCPKNRTAGPNWAWTDFHGKPTSSLTGCLFNPSKSQLQGRGS